MSWLNYKYATAKASTHAKGTKSSLRWYVVSRLCWGWGEVGTCFALLVTNASICGYTNQRRAGVKNK